MSVIGRLDDQVSEIIIKPVGERRRRDESQERLPPAEASPPAPRLINEEDKAQGEESPQASTEPELPVWLL